jgi:fused signal recognition particle receptor
MFGFLKKKLKEVVGKFSKEVEDSSEKIEENILDEQINEEKPIINEIKKDKEIKEKEEKEKAEQEAKEKEAKEKAERKAKEQEAKEQEAKEQEAEEKELQEKAEQEAKKQEAEEKEAEKQAERKAKAKELQEKAEKEAKEQEAKEQEAKEQEAEEKAERKAKEKELQEKAEQEAKKQEAKQQEAEEKEAEEKEAKEQEAEEKAEQEAKAKELQEKPIEEKKGFFSKLKDKFSHKKEEISKDKIIESIEIDVKEELKEKPIIKEIKKEETDKEVKQKAELELEKKKEVKEEKVIEEKSGFFEKISKGIVNAVTKKALTEDKFNELFWDLEIAMLENNVAVEVIDKIRDDLKKELVDTKQLRGTALEIINNTLTKSISELFIENDFDLLKQIKTKKPYIIVFVGINGSGKTTTIAKVAHLLKKNNLSCVMAAADTFRAAAIQQLEEHANNLNIKIIKHDYNADPAAVAFDAIKYANSKKIDCVLIDTAGRLHSNINLMDEMKKVIRVAKPDLKLFIGESITGNDCVEQAQKFNEAIELDGIILSKADVDDKGGAAISVSYVTKKPILYLGTGQEYDDLTKFDSKIITENLGF